MNILGYTITKTKPAAPNTALHPDLQKAIEFAFHLDNYGDLYQFSNFLDMPVERYNKFSRYEAEYRNRFSFDDFGHVLDKMQAAVDKGKLSEIAATIAVTKHLLQTNTDIEIMYKLAACAFFTKEEVLTDYDYDYNAQKIAAFRKAGLDAFFLTMPVKSLLRLGDISAEDLAIIETQSQVNKEFLRTFLSSKSLTSKSTTGA